MSEAKATQAKTVKAKALSEAKAVQAKTVKAKALSEAKVQANALSEAKALPEAKAVQAKASQEQGAKQDYQGSSYEEQDEVNVLEDYVLEEDFEDFVDLEEDYGASLGDSGFLPTKTSKRLGNTKNAPGEAKAKASRKGEAFPSRKNKQDDKKKHTTPRSGRDEHVSTSNKTVRNNTECSNKVHKTKNHTLEAQTPQDNEDKEEPKIESLGNQLGVAGQVAPRKRKMQDMANAVARAQEELAAYHAQYLSQQRKCIRLATMMDALVEEY